MIMACRIRQVYNKTIWHFPSTARSEAPRGARAISRLWRLVPEPLLGVYFSMFGQARIPHVLSSNGFCGTEFNGFYALGHGFGTGNSREHWPSLRLAAPPTTPALPRQVMLAEGRTASSGTHTGRPTTRLLGRVENHGEPEASRCCVPLGAPSRGGLPPRTLQLGGLLQH